MFKAVHFKAFAVWLIYTLVTKATLVAGLSKSLTGEDAFLINIFFSVLFGVLFLFLFSHEDFLSL